MKDHASTLNHTLLSRLKMRHLSLLQSVRLHKTLSRVAIELGLSQPAVTKALREVEDIFMAPLFERTSQGMKPTAAGQAALYYAATALADMESTALSLSAIDSGLGGRARIGVIPHLPEALLGVVLQHLLKQTPRISVMVKEGTTDELVGGLLARDLDCVIGRSFDGDVTNIVQEAIYEQEPCLLVAARSQARLSKGPLDWVRLAQLDWVFPPPNTPMRRTFNAIFVGAGVHPPSPIVETLSLKSIASVLRAEPNAITILARDMAADLSGEGGCAPLSHRLSWNLPPVSLFVTRQMAERPTMLALAQAIRDGARGLALGTKSKAH